MSKKKELVGSIFYICTSRGVICFKVETTRNKQRLVSCTSAGGVKVIVVWNSSDSDDGS